MIGVKQVGPGICGNSALYTLSNCDSGSKSSDPLIPAACEEACTSHDHHLHHRDQKDKHCHASRRVSEPASVIFLCLEQFAARKYLPLRKGKLVLGSAHSKV